MEGKTWREGVDLTAIYRIVSMHTIDYTDDANILIKHVAAAIKEFPTIQGGKQPGLALFANGIELSTSEHRLWRGISRIC